MEFIEDLNGIDKNSLKEFVVSFLDSIKLAKKVLIVFPDYTREDFTGQLAPVIIRNLRKKGCLAIDFLNAGGTHRKMTEEEFLKKLGLAQRENYIHFHNHQFDDPLKLKNIGNISSSWVARKTSGLFSRKIPVTVNRLIFEDYDLILAISGTVPHEAAGFSGGAKIFFPGISGPQVINLFHWIAALIGIPEIIGKAENSAREAINKGASLIFNKIKAKVFSLNMVNTAESSKIKPLGLYCGSGLDGFLDAYHRASEASSKVHVKYIKKPLKQVVQVIPGCYDEIWLAGKGSYKLQRPGGLQENSEIIILGPHIKRFHSNEKIESEILTAGYHCRDYIIKLFEEKGIFDTNVAAHLINVRGRGTFNPITGEEKTKFKVTLATGIPQHICESVCLGYRDAGSIRREDFTGSGKLWIREGGKYLYDLKGHEKN